MRTFTFAVVFVALIAFVSFAADSDPATGDAAYTLAASDAGGLPTERDALAGTVNPLGGIILLGGETNDGPSADATLVNPDSGEATPLAPIPKARGGLSAGTFQGKVYAIGGRDGDVALKRVDVYDPAVNKWSDGPELPKGVFGAACVSTLKDIYVIGGNGGKRAEGEVYRLEQDKKGKWDWAKLGKLKTARWGHAAVGLPDGRLLIVGGNGDDGPLASCEYFDGKKSSEAPALPEPAADLIAGVIYYPGAEIVALRGLMGPDVQAPLRLNTTLARWEARADWQALARCGAAGISWGGRLIAAGGRDHEGKRLSTVRAFGWNAEWKETLTPKDTGDFKDLRISPDGKQFAWGGTSKRLEIRDLNTLELLRSREQEDSIRSLDWSPDGKRLVVASGSKVLRVHDARTLEVVFEINTDLQAGYHTRWSPRGDLIAVGSDDKHEQRLFSAEDGHLVRELKEHTNVCTDLAFNGDGTRLFTASKDGTGRLWDVDTGKSVMTYTVGEILWGADMTPDGRVVAIGTRSGAIHVFDGVTGERRAILKHSASTLHTVRLSKDGLFVVGANRGETGEEPEYMLWSVTTGALIKELDADGTPYGQFVEFHPTKNALMVEAGYRLSILEYVPNKPEPPGDPED